jgi:hypothetical protein
MALDGLFLLALVALEAVELELMLEQAVHLVKVILVELDQMEVVTLKHQAVVVVALAL